MTVIEAKQNTTLIKHNIDVCHEISNLIETQKKNYKSIIAVYSALMHIATTNLHATIGKFAFLYVFYAIKKKSIW